MMDAAELTWMSAAFGPILCGLPDHGLVAGSKPCHMEKLRGVRVVGTAAITLLAIDKSMRASCNGPDNPDGHHAFGITRFSSAEYVSPHTFNPSCSPVWGLGFRRC